ncbi:MAG: Fic family protein [Candidatus Marsarchaeota archaeon]|nr:Fic family protein [Candidatus Marsarchaeota archaeon]MCL5418572.1 Fic family protein [Candidatus Marsarchaeota archaeon]
MDLSSFSGTLGRLVKDEANGYYYFVPAALPVNIDIDRELLGLLLQASEALGELKALGSKFEETVGFSPYLFIRPYMRKEAVLSSKIEGTVSTLHDVLEAEAKLGFNESEAKGDLLEVLNYIATQEHGIEMIRQGRDIDMGLVTELHSLLLRHVRGEREKPGTIREVQNYMSREGFPGIDEAVYVPPKASMVKELLENLFDYMSSGEMPSLVKVALMHYQFEAIHPFLDGNGRIGRLLIMLYLIKYGELSQPLLYMSAYFERNRNEYYRRLLETSTSGKYAEWVKFFTKGVIEQSESALSKSSKLFEYHKEIAARLKGTGRATAMKLADALFAHPIITIPMAARIMKVSYPAAKASVYEAVRLEILQQAGSGKAKRPKMFVARAIIDIYDA